MISIKDLKFFNKHGYNYNFAFDQDRNVWSGVVLMKKCSVGLYENEDIFILEKYNNKLVFPYSDNRVGDSLKFEWDVLNTFVDEIFLFEYDQNYVKTETSALQYTYQDGVDLIPIDKYSENLTLVNSDNTNCIQLHIGFTSTPKFDESTYSRTLYGLYNGKVFLEVTFIAESVEEDERLLTLCQNLGYNITNKDSKIFKDYPLDEYYPDYQLLNNKRKEILLEGHNIFPFVGSYKAIVNAIKYFGYDNVGIVEYWKNIENGKLFKTDKYSINDKEVIRVDGQKITLPNKLFKKTNRVSLTYDINRITDRYDEFGLPITEEYFSYTIEEAINKLQLLRKKLDKDFMPGSSHLNDVIGEGDYFGSHKIETAPQFDSCNHINCGINPSFTVSQNNIFITKNTNFTKFIIKELESSDCEFIEGEDYIIDSDSDVNINFTNKGFVKAWKLYLNGDTLDIKSMKFEQYDDSDSDDKPFYLFDPEDDNDSTAKFICHCDTFDNITIEDVLGIERDYPIEHLEYYKYGDIKEIEWIASEVVQSGTLYQEIISSGRCDIIDNIDYFFQLHHVAEYNIICNLYDSFNNCSTITKKIKVTPLQIELLGFYNDSRPLDLEYTEEEQKQFSQFRSHLLQLAYTQRIDNNEHNASIQVSNYTKHFGEYEDSDSDITVGPYKWNNLDYLRWLNSEHLTLDITNHIEDDSTLRFIHNGVCVCPYTWVCVGTDFTRIADINLSSILWKLEKVIDGTNEIDSSFETIEENYPTFTYLLEKEGSYQLVCSLKDKNDNYYSITRNLFIVSKSANYDNYIDFVKDNGYFKV